MALPSQRLLGRVAFRGGQAVLSCRSAQLLGSDPRRTHPLQQEHSCRFVLNKSYNPTDDPGKYVQNATPERLKDPEFFAFMKANVPHIYDPDYDEDGLGVWSGIDPRLMEIIKEEKQERDERKERRRLRAEDNARHYPCNIRPLATYLRDEQTEIGTRVSVELRQAKWIPGIIFGGNPNLGILANDYSKRIFVKTEHKVIQRELGRWRFNFENSRVYNLEVFEKEGDEEPLSKHVVVPQSVNWHYTKEVVYCVNFCRYFPGRKLYIPIKLVNEEESAALKAECFVVLKKSKIEVRVEEGVDIPDFIELECAGLAPKEVIRRDRLILPDGVHFTDKVKAKPFVHFLIGKVEGSGRGIKRDDDEDAKVEVKRDDKAAAAK